MYPANWQQVKEIFDAARCEQPEERTSFIEQRCGSDAELRREVESLLAHYDGLGSFLNEPSSDDPFLSPPLSDDEAPPPQPERIGRYTIRGTLGRGGMGVVYLAEQDRPRREVALKVLRRGWVSERAVRHVEHEAQVLARLQHPGIAQVYEAGLHRDAGGVWPFFAMELIRGSPLTRFAQDGQLKLRPRLDLFATVCDAVQHAHLRGVIHRDLKPANILVDSSGQPKVLDFGVARTTDSDTRLTTLKTGAKQLIGTLAYMSPEQAAGDPHQIDTRSDVYSLGVVLFELLSGRLPHELADCSIPEAVRVVADEDPTRLSTIDRVFRGDLDTIVGKALEKDRTRRYQSAADLAADVRRYLHDEPIAARPASTWYQLHKFARRNRRLVVTAGVLASLLLAASAGAIWQAVRATTARNVAQEQADNARQVKEFLKLTLGSASPYVARGRDTTLLRDILDQASERVDSELTARPQVAAEVRDIIAQAYLDLGAWDAAEQLFARNLSLHREWFGEHDGRVATDSYFLGVVLHRKGEYARARELLERALAIQRAELGEDHAAVALTHKDLGRVLSDQDDVAGAELHYRAALAIYRKLWGEENREVASVLYSLSPVLARTGNVPEAEASIREALAMFRRLLSDDDPEVVNCLSALALMHREQGDLAAAESMFREAVAIYRKLYSAGHADMAYGLTNLGLLLQDRGQHDEAEQLLREALAMERRFVPADHPHLAQIMGNLATTFYFKGNHAEAASLLREAIAILRQRSENPPGILASCLEHLAGTLRAAGGELTEAESVCREALDLRRSIEPPDAGVDSTLVTLGRILLAKGDPAAAEPFLRECLDLRRSRLPPTSWEISNVESILGECLTALGRFEQAEALLVGAHENLLAQLGAGHERTRQNLSRLTALYEAWGRPEQAAQWKSKLSGEPASP